MGLINEIPSEFSIGRQLILLKAELICLQGHVAPNETSYKRRRNCSTSSFALVGRILQRET